MPLRHCRYCAAALMRQPCAMNAVARAEPSWMWTQHLAFEAGGLLWARSPEMADIITGEYTSR